MKKEDILELLEHTKTEKIFLFIAEYAILNKAFCEKMQTALLPDEEEITDIGYYKDKANDCFNIVHRRRSYDFYEAAYQASGGLTHIAAKKVGKSQGSDFDFLKLSKGGLQIFFGRKAGVYS